MKMKKRIRSIGIVAKEGSREAAQLAEELAEWLRRRRVEPLVGQDFDPERPGDLVVVLGGDGTLLSVARALAVEIPVLGVNLGTLGFLTEIQRGELYPALVEVLDGDWSFEPRALFSVEVFRRGEAEPAHRFRAFNDAVITKSALARIIELTLRVDDQTVANFRSDGLIISTPTGSTAYNLSAGGPILDPRLPVAVLTPICPHALSLRPIVVPDSTRIEVTLESDRGDKVYVTLDGQEGTSLGPGDVVRVTRSARSIHLLKVSGRSFYDNLRAKLRWGGLAFPETSAAEALGAAPVSLGAAAAPEGSAG